MHRLVVLERTDPTCNMLRYYLIAIEPTMFGDITIRREWGRIGARSGSTRLDFHADNASARESLKTWLQRKRKKGYFTAFESADA